MRYAPFLTVCLIAISPYGHMIKTADAAPVSKTRNYVTYSLNNLKASVNDLTEKNQQLQAQKQYYSSEILKLKQQLGIYDHYQTLGQMTWNSDLITQLQFLTQQLETKKLSLASIKKKAQALEQQLQIAVRDIEVEAAVDEVFYDDPKLAALQSQYKDSQYRIELINEHMRDIKRKHARPLDISEKLINQFDDLDARRHQAEVDIQLLAAQLDMLQNTVNNLNLEYSQKLSSLTNSISNLEEMSQKVRQVINRANHKLIRQGVHLDTDDIALDTLHENFMVMQRQNEELKRRLSKLQAQVQETPQLSAQSKVD
jgi:chromosome segregation ATPase